MLLTFILEPYTKASAGIKQMSGHVFVSGHFYRDIFAYFLAKNSFSLPSSTSCSTNT